MRRGSSWWLLGPAPWEENIGKQCKFVDDDGTEWAQNEDETWYYREPGQTDWIIWED